MEIGSRSMLQSRSQLSQTFSFVQGSLQPDRQDRFSNEFMGLHGSSAVLIASSRLALRERCSAVPDVHKAPERRRRRCYPREANVHQNDIGIECCGAGNGFGRRRYHCTDLVTELSYKHGKVHGDDGIVFDDKSTHRSSDGGKRYRQLNGITRPSFHLGAKLCGEGINNARSQTRPRPIPPWPLSVVGGREL
jgi:hypothetical protein